MVCDARLIIDIHESFLLYRKCDAFPIKQKSAPRGSHCGEKEFVASRPPQAENPAMQDSENHVTNETNRESGKGDSIDWQDSRYDRYGRNEKIGNEMRY